jgi:hypothetical protein
MMIDRDDLRPWEGPLYPGDRVQILGGGPLHCEFGTVVSVRLGRPRGRGCDEYLVNIGANGRYCFFYVHGRETMNLWQRYPRNRPQ